MFCQFAAITINAHVMFLISCTFINYIAFICFYFKKNPGTVRVAEEDKGWRQTTATAWAGRATMLLSPAAARHCAPARDKVYIRSADLTRWAPRPGKAFFN